MKDGAFQALYDAYASEIYGFLYLRCGMDASSAEDLTQETFLAAYRGRFAGLSSARTWLIGIARHKLNDHYRASYRGAASSLDDEAAPELPDASADMDALISRAFDSERIAQCMRALPENYRAALTLKYAEGRSTRYIARLAGKSEKSIENTLARAKAAFAKLYTAEDDSHER